MAAKKAEHGGRRSGHRPGLVSSAKRSGPGTGFWVGLGLVAVIGVGALSWVATRPKPSPVTVDPTLPPLQATGYVLGSASAPVEVLEFADFECPGCGQFATLTEPDIRTRLVNPGLVRIRFLDYPLPVHKNTWDASLAAACANDQGKFWEMHDLIFQNQDKWNGQATGRPRGPLGDLAKSLGLDMTKYNACMDGETHRAQIQANQAEAERRHVQSTPSFIIGGQLTSGALPYDAFKKLVDAELAKKPSAPGPATALPAASMSVDSTKAKTSP